MLSKEDFQKRIQVISQQAWSVPTNTTMNAMIEYVVREALEQLIIPEIEKLWEEYEYLHDNIETLVLVLNKEPHNGSTEGRLPQPEGNTQASVKGPRKSSKTRGSDESYGRA